MSELYHRSMTKLELNKVLQMLSDRAESADGKKACLRLSPISDPEDVCRLLDETTAAYEVSTRKGYPGFGGAQDVSEALDRADRGGALLTKELLQIAGVLRCIRGVHQYGEDEDLPGILNPFFLCLTPNKHLEEKIFSSIISEDEIADTASTELADIRRHMHIQSAKIKESLQKIISSPTYAKILREQIITIRQGRYVVPVKSEHKNELPGLVHDVSATGSTIFVEPISAVNANNALRELELREKKEIARILAELSADVASYRIPIQESFVALVNLDVIFAKARLSFAMRAVPPLINSEGIVDLRNARHPLIKSDAVVPITVNLGKSFDTLIITGPNTGGKTVTLKTIGLLTLMAECGLHIPAGDGSCISVFDSVLADIGDEQSISQSLSTFSSHMRSIVEIVGSCDSKTLVLFDELGAGTDPSEGAALAMALIEYCRKMGSRVAATTHYAELKLYAMRTEGVVNASCEFDVETLQPTYRLLIGIPGKSNAFAISKKLGLSDSILKEASDLLSQSDKDFEDVLSQLETQRQQMETARREAERLRAETEKIKNESEHYSERLQAEREKVLEEAKKQARAIIEDARAAANAAMDELRQIKKQLADSADAHGMNQRQIQVRRNLNEAEEKLRGEVPAVSRPAPSRAIILGDTVELPKLGTKASVIGINKDGTYLLQAGILKLTAKADEVYLVESAAAVKTKSARPAHSGRQMQVSAPVQEIDLRGMDCVEAICVLERYLDEAMRSNVPSVRIIHGKGTGALRNAVQQSLRKNKFIKKFRLGVYGEGEDGVTIAEFL